MLVGYSEIIKTKSGRDKSPPLLFWLDYQTFFVENARKPVHFHRYVATLNYIHRQSTTQSRLTYADADFLK
jgi:hypothetical protein